jgi:AcrR family transcriptional regulator
MTKLTSRVRRTASLTRDQIVDAAIELLDRGGEAGLTFRTLSERLATGPGALYGHIANKHDLVAAACAAVILPKLEVRIPDAQPRTTIRTVALALFDVIDAHPWVGTALAWTTGQPTVIHILESIGQQVVALGVSDGARWTAVSAIFNYIVGVGCQNASNAQTAQTHGANRDELLSDVAVSWSKLDARAFPFLHSVAAPMRAHDDRADFLAGIDLILAGLTAAR